MVEEQILDDPKINEQVSYTDTEGITHVHVFDSGVSYELVDGEWVEKAPF